MTTLKFCKGRCWAKTIHDVFIKAGLFVEVCRLCESHSFTVIKGDYAFKPELSAD